MNNFFIGNETLIAYNKFTVRDPYYGICMSFTRNLSTASIVIPFSEELNKGVNEKTIEEWVNLGNELIFPAILHTGYFNKHVSHNRSDYYKIIENHIINVLVRPKRIPPKNTGYYQSDATLVGTAILNNINTSSLISTNENLNDNNRRWGELYIKTDARGKDWSGTWNIDLRDFETVDTGVCLYELVNSLYEDHKNDQKNKKKINNEDNAYVITIKYDEAVSSSHKLAMTMFYRYLYSNLYNGIVYHTLEAIKQGVDPWNALMLAHTFVMPKYDHYYGLLYKFPIEWYSMEESLKNLITHDYVNSALTKSHDSDYSPTMKKIQHSDKIDYNKLLNISITTFKCINPTKTLSKDKQYISRDIVDNKVLIKCEDFVDRWISLKRFEKI